MRASQGLESVDIKYVGELVQCNEEELLQIRTFGRKCLNEIKADMGLSLGMKVIQGQYPIVGTRNRR